MEKVSGHSERDVLRGNQFGGLTCSDVKHNRTKAGLACFPVLVQQAMKFCLPLGHILTRKISYCFSVLCGTTASAL